VRFARAFFLLFGFSFAGDHTMKNAKKCVLFFAVMKWKEILLPLWKVVMIGLFDFLMINVKAYSKAVCLK